MIAERDVKQYRETEHEQVQYIRGQITAMPCTYTIPKTGYYESTDVCITLPSSPRQNEDSLLCICGCSCGWVCGSDVAVGMQETDNTRRLSVEISGLDKCPHKTVTRK